MKLDIHKSGRTFNNTKIYLLLTKTENVKLITIYWTNRLISWER